MSVPFVRDGGPAAGVGVGVGVGRRVRVEVGAVGEGGKQPFRGRDGSLVVVRVGGRRAVLGRGIRGDEGDGDGGFRVVVIVRWGFPEDLKVDGRRTGGRRRGLYGVQRDGRVRDRDAAVMCGEVDLEGPGLLRSGGGISAGVHRDKKETFFAHWGGGGRTYSDVTQMSTPGTVMSRESPSAAVEPSGIVTSAYDASRGATPKSARLITSEAAKQE